MHSLNSRFTRFATPRSGDSRSNYDACCYRTPKPSEPRKMKPTDNNTNIAVAEITQAKNLAIQQQRHKTSTQRRRRQNNNSSSSSKPPTATTNNNSKMSTITRLGIITEEQRTNTAPATSGRVLTHKMLNASTSQSLKRELVVGKNEMPIMDAAFFCKDIVVPLPPMETKMVLRKDSTTYFTTCSGRILPTNSTSMTMEMNQAQQQLHHHHPTASAQQQISQHNNSIIPQRRDNIVFTRHDGHGESTAPDTNLLRCNQTTNNAVLTKTSKTTTDNDNNNIITTTSGVPTNTTPGTTTRRRLTLPPNARAPDLPFSSLLPPPTNDKNANKNRGRKEAVLPPPIASGGATMMDPPPSTTSSSFRELSSSVQFANKSTSVRTSTTSRQSTTFRRCVSLPTITTTACSNSPDLPCYQDQIMTTTTTTMTTSSSNQETPITSTPQRRRDSLPIVPESGDGQSSSRRMLFSKKSSATMSSSSGQEVLMRGGVDPQSSSSSSSRYYSSQRKQENKNDHRCHYYQVGETLRDESHSIPFTSSAQAYTMLSKIPMNSPLFVKRTSREWTFATLVGWIEERQRHDGGGGIDESRGISVVVSLHSKRNVQKVLKQDRWKKCLKLVNTKMVVVDCISSSSESPTSVVCGGNVSFDTSSSSRRPPSLTGTIISGAHSPNTISRTSSSTSGLCSTTDKETILVSSVDTDSINPCVARKLLPTCDDIVSEEEATNMTLIMTASLNNLHSRRVSWKIDESSSKVDDASFDTDSTPIQSGARGSSSSSSSSSSALPASTTISTSIPRSISSDSIISVNLNARHFWGSRRDRMRPRGVMRRSNSISGSISLCDERDRAKRVWCDSTCAPESGSIADASGGSLWNALLR